MAVNNDEEDDNRTSTSTSCVTMGEGKMSRKERRKAAKKMKRKQVRREAAVKEREEEEARMNDPEEQRRLVLVEKEEEERMERDRRVFEERERLFVEALERKRKEEEAEEKERARRREEEDMEAKDENTNEINEDDDWEYVEEGPAEIIWKGNEIIVKKKTVRVPKKASDQPKETQEAERPISNPLAPQSEAFEEYKSAQEVLDSVAHQVPNFGTEQDKAHCPFHLKTGVCRFGPRCSRVHFYPDKSCTLLIKNMYNGPGLAWEQDEGLEYTDEEVERSFEEFYEDVHTEFLKFGEIVNFKVCKNGSSHLRGNVYVNYKLLESAVLAYQSLNARYFAGKQLSCEFVNVTRWKVAICGEYMKSRLKACSRGSTCNFIHCFRNPGGDYEWADWDKPAPRYWLKKMDALFGTSGGGFKDDVSPGYKSRRSRSRGLASPCRKSHSDEDVDRKRRHSMRNRGDSREEARHLPEDIHEEKVCSQDCHRIKRRKPNSVDFSNRTSDDRKFFGSMDRNSTKRERDLKSTRQDRKSKEDEVNTADDESRKEKESDRHYEHKSKRSSRQKSVSEFTDKHHHCSEERDLKSTRQDRKSKKDEVNTADDECRTEKESDGHREHKSRRSSRQKSVSEYTDKRHHCSEERDLKSTRQDRKSKQDEVNTADDECRTEKESDGHREHKSRRSSRQKSVSEYTDKHHHCSEERDLKSTRLDRKSKEDEVKTADDECRTEKESDGHREHKSRRSSRQKSVSEFTDKHFHCSEEFSRSRESHHVDRDIDKYHRYRGKHSLHKKEEVDALDVESHGQSLDRKEDRRRRHGKKSSHMKNDADLSDFT